MLLNPNEVGALFEAFPKIPRLEKNGVLITEKIDELLPEEAALATTA